MAKRTKRRPHGSRAKRWRAIAGQLASKLSVAQEPVLPTLTPEQLLDVGLYDADFKLAPPPPVVERTKGPVELEIERRMSEGVETLYTDAIDKLVDLPDVLRKK